MMKIVAGTYEGFCYGWESLIEPGKITTTNTLNTSTNANANNSQQLPSDATTNVEELPLTFGYNVHVGCLKSVAMATSGNRAGRLLVTGGADERVRIYDMKDRTELGELQQHNGTVTCMEFYKSTHLLTGSEDHTVCIWRVHDWALLHVLGGHKAAVTSLSIHPSGRMALSVSRDRTMRLWNLLEGRCAYIKRLQGEGELVRWSPQGDSYLIVVGTGVTAYSAGTTAEAMGECKHRARVNSACFVGGIGGEKGDATAIATCADDKTVRFFRAIGGKPLGQLDMINICPTGRVRDVCYVAPSEDTNGDDAARGALVTVTSAGRVSVWGVPSLESVGEKEGGEAVAGTLDIPLLATHAVKGEPRFTCVAACLSEDTLATEDRRDQAQRTKKNSKKRKQRPVAPVESEDKNDNKEDKNGLSAAKKKSSKKKKVKSRDKSNAGKNDRNGASPRAGGGAGSINSGSGKKKQRK